MTASPAPCGARLRDGHAELTVLARSQWPALPRTGLPPTQLPGIPGFIISSFSPLAAELAQRCLRQCFGDPPADAERGGRTAIVLASTTGDIATAAAIASAVDQGRAVPPLLFYQSNPNAVAGHIAARWGLAGPVVCTIPAGAGPSALADAMDSAALLIEGAEADAALVVLADQGGPDGDRGVAVLVGPAAWLQQTAPEGEATAVRDIGSMSGTP
ncbi:MAG TPA: beta-ketoacyl synthase chain length factor [Trebonia sp.]|nr:beta-ketoacyl synthase chain length factor [Trebonia sp.]